MKSVFWAASAVLLSVCQVHSSTIHFTGTPPVEKQALLRSSDRLLRSSVPRTVALDSIAFWLIELGYLEATARQSGDSILVSAGPLYRLETVRVSHDSTMAFHPRTAFSKLALEAAADSLLSRYQVDGHYYARASIDSTTRAGNDLSISAKINPGPVVTIRKRIYNGLRYSRPGLVDRFLRNDFGELLTQTAIERVERDASAIPFLEAILPVTVEPCPGYTQADLVFTFAEKRQFRFFGGAGYLPDNSTGLVWNVDLTLQNLFGDGRQLSLRSERRELGKNTLSISYVQPSFLLGIGELRAEVSTRDYRNQFYEFAMSAEQTTRLADHLDVGVGIGWKRVEPAQREIGYNRVTAEVTGSRSSFGLVQNPVSGVALSWSVAYAHRSYRPDSSFFSTQSTSFSETRTSASFDWYHCLAGPIVSRLRARYQGLETSESTPPLSELYLVGGALTLRGFRNDQFAAQRTVLATVEPRVRFHSSYLFLFCDAAYINRPSSGSIEGSTVKELFRNGYGVGFAIVDRASFLRLSLGWNPEVALSEPRLLLEFSAGL